MTERQTEPLEWEPNYGFIAYNVHPNEELAAALEAVRRRICGYGGNRCDCKYGLRPDDRPRTSEATGCPELTEVINRLLHRPESFMGIPTIDVEPVLKAIEVAASKAADLLGTIADIDNRLVSLPTPPSEDRRD